jgi:hypothetical protein
MNPTLLDLLDRPIEVGDTIAYPGRRGSSVYMNVGVVREVVYDWQSGHSLRVERTKDNTAYRELGRVVTLREYDRAVVVDKAIGAAPVEFGNV